MKVLFRTRLGSPLEVTVRGACDVVGQGENWLLSELVLGFYSIHDYDELSKLLIFNCK